jgi:hypothetical protein
VSGLPHLFCKCLFRTREILLATVSFSDESTETRGHQHETMPEVAGPEHERIEQRRLVADQIREEDRPWLLIPPVEIRQVTPVARAGRAGRRRRPCLRISGLRCRP